MEKMEYLVHQAHKESPAYLAVLVHRDPLGKMETVILRSVLTMQAWPVGQPIKKDLKPRSEAFGKIEGLRLLA